MLAIRLIKTGLVASCALFAILVTLNNLIDYDRSYQFVRHTLSMDTIFPDNGLMHRAIVRPFVWAAAYWAIILTEAAIGLTLAVAGIRMAMSARTPARQFDAAKSLAIVGAGIGVLLWFGGFMVIGGEWFAMWQSPTWNGQNAAFRFVVVLLGVMIFLDRSDNGYA